MAKVLKVARRPGILRSVCIVCILAAACLGLAAWGATVLARDRGPGRDPQFGNVAIPPDRSFARESAVIRASHEEELAAITTSVPKAIPRLEGKVLPGASVLLKGRESTGGALTYRWRQLAGPDILPPAAGQSDISVVLPGGGQPLEFELMVANQRGIDAARLAVAAAPEAANPRPLAPIADAGDDQVAVVGRQVTLNGMRSHPKGQVGYRWVQVGGPKTRFQLEEGPYFSFVPVAPGVYRFALIVATGSQTSEPDEVSITVGALAAMGGTLAATDAGAVEPDSLDQVARRALNLVHAKPETIDQLVIIFEEIAHRMDLYEDYASMFRELSQRLEMIITGSPSRRSLWMERVFNPLAMGLIRVMQEEGLDLSRPEGQNAPLNHVQRARLAEQFRLMAEGFRSATKKRTDSLVLPPISPSGH